MPLMGCCHTQQCLSSIIHVDGEKRFILYVHLMLKSSWPTGEWKTKAIMSRDERSVHPNLSPHNVVLDKALYHNAKLRKVKTIKMSWNETWKVFCKKEDVR